MCRLLGTEDFVYQQWQRLVMWFVVQKRSIYQMMFTTEGLSWWCCWFQSFVYCIFIVVVVIVIVAAVNCVCNILYLYFTWIDFVHQQNSLTLVIAHIAMDLDTKYWYWMSLAQVVQNGFSSTVIAANNGPYSIHNTNSKCNATKTVKSKEQNLTRTRLSRWEIQIKWTFFSCLCALFVEYNRLYSESDKNGPNQNLT